VSVFTAMHANRGIPSRSHFHNGCGTERAVSVL